MGRSGRARRPRRPVRQGSAATGAAKAGLALLLMAGLAAVLLWTVGSSLFGYFFDDVIAARSHGYRIERVDVDAHLETDGDLRVTQTMVLDFTRDVKDGFTITVPLSSATAEQLEERGVADTGLSVDLLRDDDAGVNYERVPDGAVASNAADSGPAGGGAGANAGAEPGTYTINSLLRTIRVNGAQPQGRATWSMRYTLDNSALTWSDAGELIWRYASTAPGQSIGAMRIHLVYDGAVAGTPATPGHDLTAQPAEDPHARVSVDVAAGRASVAVETSMRGGESGTLHSMFPRDWIADSPMPEPSTGARMANGVAYDASLERDLGRRRLMGRLQSALWRIPAVLALIMAATAIPATFRRLRLGLVRPTFRDRISDEPVLTDHPWLLACLMGPERASRAYVAALMRASIDGAITIVDPGRGFPTPVMPDGSTPPDAPDPSAVGRSRRGKGNMGDGRNWWLWRDGALRYDPDAAAPVDAALAATFCADRRARVRADSHDWDGPFHVEPRSGGYLANPDMMDAWSRHGRLCASVSRGADMVAGRALKATGWVVAHGAGGGVATLIGGPVLLVAALFARRFTGDWTMFAVTVAATALGMALRIGMRSFAYGGEGVDLHARAQTIGRWFETRGWERGRRRPRARGRGEQGLDGGSAGFDGVPAPFTREQAEGLLLDAVAIGVDEDLVAEFAEATLMTGVLNPDDPVVWWCRKDGRAHAPAEAMRAAHVRCVRSGRRAQR